MRFLDELLNERLDDIAADLRKSNGEYTRAFFKRRELFIEINKVISYCNTSSHHTLALHRDYPARNV